MKIFASVYVVVLLVLPATATTQDREPVFTAPPNYVESAPEGMFECPEGQTSMVSRAQYRKFALRNEVWPQEEGVDLSRKSWSAGRTTKKPSLGPAKELRGLRARLYVLVGGDGSLLDKIVVCTNSPESSSALLEAIDVFEFEPSRYKKRGLNTVMPVDFAF